MKNIILYITPKGTFVDPEEFAPIGEEYLGYYVWYKLYTGLTTNRTVPDYWYNTSPPHGELAHSWLLSISDENFENLFDFSKQYVEKHIEDKKK